MQSNHFDEVSLLESVGADVPGGYHRCGVGEGYPLVFVSKSFLNAVGYTKEQLMEEKQNRFLELVAPEDKEFFLSHAPILEEKGRVDLNYRIVRRDGSYRWVQDSTKHTVINGIDYYQCTLADITEFVEKQEKMAAENLEYHKKEIYLSAIVDNIPGGFHRCKIEEGYPFLYIGDSFVRMMGWTREEIAERFDNKFQNMIVTEDKSRVKDLTEGLSEEGVGNAIYRMYHKDGGYRWIQDSTILVKTENEQFYQGAISDVTVFVENLSKLISPSGEMIAMASKEQILSEITQMLYGYNVTLNLRTGKYTLLEGTGLEEFTRIYQFTDDFEESRKYKLERMNPEFKQAYTELVSLDNLRKIKDRSGHIGTLQYSVNFDNKERWHEINVFIGADQYGERIAHILCRDVTEEYEKVYIKNQLEIAQASNETKTRFLSNMSHDIRTPINGIIGMLHIAKIHREDKARVNDCLNKIEISANYLLTLLNDILDLNKLESGKMAMEENAFNVNDLTDDIYNIIQPSAQMAGITIKKEQGIFQYPEVVGSATHLRQILMNLISNAIKYSHAKGTVCVQTEELNREEDIIWYQFSVKDCGIGMTKEFQQRMFDMFEQEQAGARTTHKGSGLGLSIVKMLVELFGGTLTVESEKGKGSTFRVILPFKINHNPLPAENKAIVDTADCLKDIRILLVEDNELNMEIAQEILQNAGAIITQAENGKKAVEIFEAAPAKTFDVILMDVMMPEIDGLEATRIIRRMDRLDAKKIPIIAMTANAFSEDIEKSLEAGMNEHIAKPLNMKVLATAVAKLLVEIGDE